MREIRLHGSEGGEAKAFPTPISRDNNKLIMLGVEARIATLFEDPLIKDWTRLYTQPVVYRNAADLINQFPPSNIAVATLWSTAPWAKAAVEAGHARQGVYYLGKTPGSAGGLEKFDISGIR